MVLRLFPKITDIIDMRLFRLPKITEIPGLFSLVEEKKPVSIEEEILKLKEYISEASKLIKTEDFDTANKILRSAIELSSCPKCKKELAIVGIETSRLSALKSLEDKDLEKKKEELIKKIEHIEEKLKK